MLLLELFETWKASYQAFQIKCIVIRALMIIKTTVIINHNM